MIAIRFIVDCFFSNPDVYGNRYWFARIISTKSGETLTVQIDHSSNAAHAMTKRFGPSCVHYTEQGMPIRIWNRLNKGLDHMSFNENDMNRIEALEDADKVDLIL